MKDIYLYCLFCGRTHIPNQDGAALNCGCGAQLFEHGDQQQFRHLPNESWLSIIHIQSFVDDCIDPILRKTILRRMTEIDFDFLWS